MGMFDGYDVDSATVGYSSVYLEDGLYKVEITGVEATITRTNGPAVIFKFNILESSNPSRPPGMSAQKMELLQKEGAIGRIKGTVAAILGFDPHDPTLSQKGHPNCITQQTVEFVYSEHNPLKGRQVIVECSPVTTKKGAVITGHNWKPITAA